MAVCAQLVKRISRNCALNVEKERCSGTSILKLKTENSSPNVRPDQRAATCPGALSSERGTRRADGARAGIEYLKMDYEDLGAVSIRVYKALGVRLRSAGGGGLARTAGATGTPRRRHRATVSRAAGPLGSCSGRRGDD
jgi:hypothetical protein